MTVMTTRSRRLVAAARRSALIPERWFAPTVVAVTVLVLAGCGADADDPQVASAGGAATADSEPTDDSTADQDERALEFAECMREHGVDMPDPQPGQNGGFRAFGGPDEDMDEDTLTAALDACRDLAPMLERDGEIDPERQEQMLALTECLREHGIDVPDPSAGGGGGVLIGPDDNVDREEMEAAMDACRDQVGLEPPDGARKEGENS